MKPKAKKYRHKQYKYMVMIEWSEEDQAYLAKVPELQGLTTHGNTPEAAARHATDAITTWIEGAKETGIAIPDPVVTRKLSGRFVTRIDPQLHCKLLMHAKRKGKSLNGIVSDFLRKMAEAT